MGSKRGLARVVAVAISAAGVVGAHALAYRLAHADDAARAHVLEASGHGYWDLAVLMGLAGLVVAVGIEMAFGGRHAGSHRSAPSTWSRLLAIQGLTFIALESIERAVQGPQELMIPLNEPAFLVALPLLAISAALGCAVLLLARRAGAILARLRRAPLQERRIALRIEANIIPVISRLGFSNAHERAPPLSLVA